MSEKRQLPRVSSPTGFQPCSTEPPLHPKCPLQLREPPKVLENQSCVEASTSLFCEISRRLMMCPWVSPGCAMMSLRAGCLGWKAE